MNSQEKKENLLYLYNTKEALKKETKLLRKELIEATNLIKEARRTLGIACDILANDYKKGFGKTENITWQKLDKYVKNSLLVGIAKK